MVNSPPDRTVHMSKPASDRNGMAEWSGVLLLVLTLCLQVVTEIQATATVSREAAKNVTSSLGETGSITCPLVGTMELEQELKIFRHVNSSWILLSANKISQNTTKYVVTGEYVLTIRDVSFQDEGWYRCDVTSSHVDRYLSVVDFSSASLSIFWSSATDEGLHPGATVTMTCHVTHSRPPALIRWTRGSHDVTDMAYVIKSNADAQGYGDTTSVLTFQLTMEDASAIYRCAADVGNHKDALYDRILIQSDEFSRALASTTSSTKTDDEFQQTNFITENPKSKDSKEENIAKEGATTKTKPEKVLSTSSTGEFSRPRLQFLLLPVIFATSLCIG